MYSLNPERVRVGNLKTGICNSAVQLASNSERNELTKFNESVIDPHPSSAHVINITQGKLTGKPQKIKIFLVIRPLRRRG